MGDAGGPTGVEVMRPQEKGLCDGCTFEECLRGTLGMACAFFLFIGGIATCMSFTSLCWAVGLYMIVCSIVVGMIESPVLFKWNQTMIGLVNRIQSMKKYHYGRGFLYLALSVFLFFCLAFSTIINALILIAMAAFAIRTGMKEARAAAAKEAAGGDGGGGGGQDDDDLVEDPFAEQLTDEDKARQSFSFDGMMDSIASAVGTAVIKNSVYNVFGSGSSQPEADIEAASPGSSGRGSTASGGLSPKGGGDANPFDDDNPFAVDDDDVDNPFGDDPFGQPATRV